MATHSVSASRRIERTADVVWAKVRAFDATWHPAIATMALEHGETGRAVRAFTVHGEDTVYRERLTWFSDSDRAFAYTHIAGIAGVDQYDARLSVQPITDGACTVTLAATLDAAEPRASDIATGTQAIFDDAVATLAGLVYPDAAADTKPINTGHDESTLSTVNLAGTPTLSVSHRATAHADTTTLCLFLHGIGGNRRNWDTQLVAVAPHCPAAALDLRGYGDSTLGDSQTSVDDYCRDILRVADHFKAQKLILCGLSYGAWIATSFALRYPERLAGLVLSGGCTGMSEADATERDAFRESREVPLDAGKTPTDFAANVVDVIAGPSCSDTVRGELLESMQSIPAATYRDALRCFTNPPETFDFTQIRSPVLLMTGDADKLAPPAEIKQVAMRIHQSAAMPDVRFEVLPDAGHVCNLEAPDAYNAPLIDFVERLST